MAAVASALKVRLAPHFDPDVVAAARGHDRESFFGMIRSRDLVLGRPVLLQSHTLVEREDLAEHACDGVRRQHASRQLDLPPGERPAELIHRLGSRHHVRLLADVHHECIAVEPHDRVE